MVHPMKTECWFLLDEGPEYIINVTNVSYHALWLSPSRISFTCLMNSRFINTRFTNNCSENVDYQVTLPKINNAGVHGQP